MAVSKELLLELQHIIKEEYNKDLTPSEASQIGNGLVDYFDLLAKMDYENKDSDIYLTKSDDIVKNKE